MMKRIYGAVLLTAAVLVLAATASAQNLPSQFVISGETARRIHDFTTINLATAERIAETCERLASKEGVAVSIYILDNDGNHVYMHRMDGQGYLNIVTAEMKARTALMGREASKNRMNRVIQNPDTDLPQSVAPRSSLPPEFVVSGRAAANIFDANQISGEAAKKIARTCRAWAAEHGGAASIYIIDTHGTFVHQERGDGQVYNNIRTAMLKAQTALQTRQPTSIRAAQLRNDPGGQPRQLMQFGFFTVSGGLPIVVDGEMIGAIGA